MSTPEIAALTHSFEDVAHGLDKSWMIICGAMVFSMQLGFAWLEAGAIRKKNAMTVYYKLILNTLITVFTWWILGYAFAFGSNNGGRFVGARHFYAGNQWGDAFGEVTTQYAHWTFQVSICAVVPAITGGVIAERATLLGTAIHTFFLTLLIYPFVISWTWGMGWMTSEWTYKDFTGSGMIHCIGSFAGLAGLIIIGPRYGRFGQHKSVFDESRRPQPIISAADTQSPTKNALPHNALESAPLRITDIKSEEDNTAFTLENVQRLRAKVNEDVYDQFGPSDLGVTLQGAIFLWLGFIFFNAGSSIILHKHEAWLAAEKAAANTFLAGFGGAIIAGLFKHPLLHGWHAPRSLRDDACTIGNAFLGGMVANGAGMNAYEPWEAIVVGAIGGIFYTLLCVLFEKKEWDDALEAFQLHGGCGTAGVWAAAFFNHDTGVFHDKGGHAVWRHIVCWIIFASWSFIWSYIIFYMLNRYNLLRVDLKTEIVGTDYIDFAGDLKFDINRRIEKKGHSKHSQNIELTYQSAPKNEA